MQEVKLHKVAKHSALYSFCISNYEAKEIEITLNVRFGFELGDINILPEESDQEMI